MKLHSLTSICPALILALLAAGAQAQTLRWASAGDPLTLDPYSQNETLTNNFNHQIYEQLVERDKQLAFVPGLATEWTQVEPLLWRLKLRPGVKFHDGRPFSADDVLFSVQRARQKTSQFAVYAGALGEPRKVDDLTVEFRLSQFNPIFLDHLGAVLIMSRGWCEEHDAVQPLDFSGKEERYTTFHANGTGPYMLVSREPDVRTVLKRNPNYWGQIEGNIQEIVYTPIRSDATRVAALVSGQVDFILDPPPRDLERLRRARGLRLVEGQENRIIFVGMDQGRDELLYASVKGKNPFKDLRVRRALYQAIDIETLRTKLMNGQAAPTGAVVPSARAHHHDPEVEKRLPYDPAAARRLMREAGYADGFGVTMDCPNNRYINDERICQTLASMWARIGVKVRVNAMPKSTFFPKLEKLDTSLYLFGWGGPITDAETTFTPIYRNRGEKGVGEYNRGNYRNDTLDALAAASGREIDPEKRRALIRQVFLLHNENVHHIPLHRQFNTWAMRSDIQAAHRADNHFEVKWVTKR
ncbi:ABC transporter substrate-binding protein [Aquabacterium sp. A7-Y]|uniref:ABC transporter substrate-binding protein n=1 Tax=Aquabacterium sp. A7-Y TaxID=1349605 RepID=UPI00223D6E5B|nr:ABC transporter substrate-binding protein [Aquabacterium sp. A7-Y]MCW7539724.1 ABC transporter substrate-binding protein [Aquabacterium sp. A7-Y]